MLQPTSQPVSQSTNQQSRVSVSIQRPLSHSTSHRSTNRLKRPLYRPSPQPISLRMWCSFQIYRLINKTKAQKKKTKSVVSKCCIVPSVLSSFCLHFTHAESMGWPNKSADFLYFKKIQPHGLDKKNGQKENLLMITKKPSYDWVTAASYGSFSQIPPSFWTFHPRPVIVIVWSLVKRFMQTFSGVVEAT